MANRKPKVKVTKKKQGGGKKKVHLSTPRMNLHIKIDANGKKRKEGW